MDPTAVNANVTVDDFDCVLAYPIQSNWETPDPSSATFDASATPWWLGTYHKTEVVNASLSFNFTGPAIYIYGASGPSYGSYEVQLDSASTAYSAYAASNASSPFLLFSATNLTYAKHNIVLRNLGARAGDAGGNSFLFDYLRTTVQLAPAGASVANTTIQEDDPALTYSGKWDSNTSPNFSGGGTTFTQDDKASVSLSFHGSAIYVFGDKKNDHGLYNVFLDNGTAEVYSGISGCGGAFGMTCEQMKPTIKYFASNLDDSLHTLRIENLAGVNASFFDLDSIVVTVPSVYAPRQLTDAPTPAPPSAGTPSAGGTGSNSTNAAPPSLLALSSNPLLLLALGVFCLLRPSLRR